MQLKTEVFLVLFVTTFTTNVLSDSDIVITKAWISEAPPTVTIHAGYMNIKNTSMENITIMNIDSSSFRHIEIHKTQIENGIAKMQKQKSLTIPANSEFNLEPGGYHLMLFDSDSPLKSGDHVSITIILSNGEQLLTTAEVKQLDLYKQHYHH